MQIDGFDVQKAVVEWNDNQVAANDAGATLVPQRELFGNIRLLVDKPFNLHRPHDEFLAGQLIGDEVAIVGGVVAGGNPRHHVRLFGRGEGLDEQKFSFGFAGQAEHDVIRLHVLGDVFHTENLLGQGA